MTLRKLSALAAVAVLALTGCSSTATDATDSADPGDGGQAESPAAEILAGYGLDGLDGREIVDRLDRTPVADRESDLMASVRPGELLLSESDGTPVPVDLPEDEFYLSVAPYRENTHDCFFHSLTTCRGELAGERVHVTITDRDTGEALVDEEVETFDNGFLGFWLPSGIEATIEIDHDGSVGSQDIATGPDDPTCLTTLQLT